VGCGRRHGRKAPAHHRLDAASGKILWHSYLGATISNAPQTYSLDGHQYLFTAAGDTLYAFYLY
jgi:alcohol dehydrogenase (cytochrome c)